MVILSNNSELTQKDIREYLRNICDARNYGKLSLYSITNICTKNIQDGITEEEFYKYLAQTCNDFTLNDYNYSMLAGNIVVDQLYKANKKSLLYVTEQLKYDGTLDNLYYQFVTENIEILESFMRYENDYNYSYRSLTQFLQMYSAKDQTSKQIESPQHTLMRVAINLYLPNHFPLNIHSEEERTRFAYIKETYDLLSEKKYSHATPTIIGSGFKYMASASCFMFEVQDEIREDNVNGIYDVEKEIALNNKYMGGNGIYVGRIRSAGTRIKSINGGKASGLIPYAKGFSQVNHAVSQANKRPGVTALFLDIHHPEIRQFCKLRNAAGDELSRARNLNIGVMVSDLFMKRLINGDLFSLMDPSECPGLADVYGDDFEKLYLEYEAKGMYREQIPARELMSEFIIKNMNETGEPYILFRDHINRKSMIKHVCVVNGSNLCVECTLIMTKERTGVCFLSSLVLPSFVDPVTGTFDFKELMRVTRVITRNLNILIDINNYPTVKARRGSLDTRSIGIGVQGLADVFALLRMEYGSPESTKLNKQIFEAIYYAAVSESADLAEIYGSYPLFEGSPHSQGMLQFDMWDCNQFEYITTDQWCELKDRVKRGMRNSQLTALMPTASASIFMGFNESFECIVSNMYRKNNIAGENVVCNRYMMNHLKELGLWDIEMKERILGNQGKIPEDAGVPEEVRRLYKSIYEVGNKASIDLCADRGPFIDQSQSMNLYFDQPSNDQLIACLKHAWIRGLKTGSYYTKVKISNTSMKHDVCLSCQ